MALPQTKTCVEGVLAAHLMRRRAALRLPWVRPSLRPWRRLLSANRPAAERLVLWADGAAERLKPLPHVCRGCGWELQSERPGELGYVPAAPLDAPGLEDPLHPEGPASAASAAAVAREGDDRDPDLVCMRCHRVQHHNQVLIEAPDQGKKLATLRQRDGVVLLLVDMFDVDGSLPAAFADNVSGANPVILVGNKIDLLPQGATEYRLRMWLAQQAELRGLKPCTVAVISSRTGHGLRELLSTVRSRSDSFRKDVFVCGRTNVGKSTFLNKMIRMFQGPRSFMVTESGLHGTTLGLIPIPIGHHKRFIYDTPGLLGEQRVRTALTQPEQHLVQPPSGARIRPIVYRLIPGKSLLLGDFARLDYEVGGGHLLFTVFVSNRLAMRLHATAIEKRQLERS